MFWTELESRGAAPALITPDGTPGGRALSYAGLAAAADAWARRYGELAPGEGAALIAIEIAPDAEVIAAYLGALRAGHAVLLADAAMMAPDHPVQTLYRPNIRVTGRGDAARAEPGAPERPAMHPDLAVLLSTSGTTGAPKLVRLSAGNVGANAGQIAEYLRLDATERAILTLPLHYSYGMSVLHAHLAAGGSLVLTEASVITDAFWEQFRQTGATSLALVPHQFDLLASSGFAERQVEGLRYITQAGGKLAPARVEEFRRLGAQGGWKLWVMYGQTEAGPRISYIPPEDLEDNADTIGRPIPRGTLWIADEAGEPVEGTGVAGELIYEGPNVMLGYAETREDLGLPAEPARLETGDIAERNARGYFRIVGRKKRFVKLFGLRMSLDQMDQALAQAGHQAWCQNVSDRLVVLHTDPDAGPDVAGVLAAAYDFPLDAILTAPLGEVPLLSSGKLDYRALQALAEEAAAQAPGAAAGDDDLRAVIARATRRREIRDEDSFAALGGDSLGYLQVALALEERLGAIPDGWEAMPVAELEALRPQEAGGLSSLDADVAVRLLAVGFVVLRHANQWPLAGGTWVLLTIVGYSIARFGRGPILAGRPWRLFAQMIYPIVPLYYLMLLAYLAAGKAFSPGMALLTANLGPEGPGVLVTPNWFISLYVQLLIIILGVLSLPAMRRAARGDPWQLGMISLAVALAGSLVYQGFFAPEMGDPETRKAWIYVIRVPMTCLPFAVLGWCIFCAEGAARRAITAAAVLVTVAVFPAPEPDYYIVIAALCLYLLSGWRLPMPARIARVLRIAATTTLFVYLLHGIPVHAFRYVINLNALAGPAVAGAVVLVVAFIIAWIAKLAFDRFDILMMRLWARKTTDRPDDALR